MSLSLSVYTVDYYLARKKEEILSLASPWTNLEQGGPERHPVALCVVRRLSAWDAGLGEEEGGQ